jgi:hypothetical protein
MSRSLYHRHRFRLEPCAWKGARTVLRGRGAGNSASLPDRIHISIGETLCVAAILFLTTSAAAQRNSPSQTINAEGLFTFQLPVGFKQSEMGIDSFMRGYQRGRARFIFICGDSASPEFNEKNMRDLREESVTIDGKHASVRTFLYRFERASRYMAELNFGDWRKGRMELYMGMDSPNPTDIQTAKQIFSSVKFLKTGCA